jgi:hypothetical protein
MLLGCGLCWRPAAAPLTNSGWRGAGPRGQHGRPAETEAAGGAGQRGFDTKPTGYPGQLLCGPAAAVAAAAAGASCVVDSYSCSWPALHLLHLLLAG